MRRVLRLLHENRRLRPLTESESLGLRDHILIEKAVRHVLTDSLYDIFHSDQLEQNFQAALDPDKLEDPRLAEQPWGDVFKRVLITKRVSRLLDTFIDRLADAAMAHVATELNKGKPQHAPPVRAVAPSPEPETGDAS